MRLKGWTWWQKIAAHIGALIPLSKMLWDFWFDQLTVNPIQELTLRTGWYALILLLLSLAITPLNTLFGWRHLLPLRKPLGLYAFTYASLHFLIFIGLDYGLDLDLILEATFEKRFALVGFAAFMVLLPLAITSTQGWQRRLRKNWKRLHRGVYLAGILAITHFVMLVKADVREPLAYGAVLAVLLLLRFGWVKKQIRNLRGLFSGRGKKQEEVTVS